MSIIIPTLVLLLVFVTILILWEGAESIKKNDIGEGLFLWFVGAVVGFSTYYTFFT